MSQRAKELSERFMRFNNEMIAFVAGLFVGVFIGIFVVCLCLTAKEADVYTKD